MSSVERVQVGSIVNFSLMYMLAKTPSQAVGAGSRNLAKALFDTNTLKRMGAPGAPLMQSTLPCPASPTSLPANECSTALPDCRRAGGNFFEPGFPLGKRFLNLGVKVRVSANIALLAIK